MSKYTTCKLCNTRPSKHKVIHLDSINACVDESISAVVEFINFTLGCRTYLSCEENSAHDKTYQIAIYSEHFDIMRRYLTDKGYDIHEFYHIYGENDESLVIEGRPGWTAGGINVYHHNKANVEKEMKETSWEYVWDNDPNITHFFFPMDVREIFVG